MQANTVNQLSLFQFGQPAGNLGRFLNQKNSEKDGKVVGVSVALAKRKDIAKLFDLSPKKDGERLNAEMLKLSDELKTTIGREVTGIIGSNQFTGGRMTVRVNKEGLKRVTCSFVEVKRHENKVSDEEMAALLGLTVDEVKELRLAKEKEASSKTVTIEIESKAPEAVAAE